MKIYGIDKKRLESEETYWKNTDLNDDSNLNSLMFIQTILASLVPIESEKKEECIYCDKSIPRNNYPGGINFVCKKHLIEQPKEERCTKCNGVGSIFTQAGNIHCSHCNGTGKEPRKEELPGTFLYREYMEARHKLSIAVDALESLKLYFDVSECECGEKESDTDGALYVNEALEKLKGGTPKPLENSFPTQTASVSGRCIMSCSRHCIGSGGGNGAEIRINP